MKRRWRALKTGREELFTTTPVMQAVLTLAVPTVISQIITVIYNMADTFFIGRMNDPAQVAAAQLAMPIFIFMSAFSGLFGIGGSSVISRSLGAGDRNRARQCASFCILTGAAVGILYGVLIYGSRGILFPVLGADQRTWAPLEKYVFWTVAVGALPTILNTELAYLIRSEGYSKQASFGVAMGGILNMILDPIFIFALHLQIVGAAIATMLSNVAACIYFGVFLYRIRENSTITPNPKYYSANNGLAREVVTVGLPSSIMTLMSTISNTTLNHLIASYSTEAIAGMGIAKKIDLLALAIAGGMTQGTLPLIGYNYSSGDRKRMTDAIRALAILSIGIALAGTLLLLIGSGFITKLFINDALTVHYGSRFLRIICLACVTTTLNFMIITIFQATGKKIQPMILSFLRKGVLDIPLMILLNGLRGVEAIPWATPAADLLALIIACSMFVPFLKEVNKTI